MNTLKIYIILVGIVFGSQSIVKCDGVPENMTIEFNKQLANLKELWNQREISQYYLEVKNIINEIVELENKSYAEWMATLLLSDLLAHSNPEEYKGSEDLYVNKRLSYILMSNNSKKAEDRSTHILLIALFFGNVRDEMVPNYVQRPVFMNIAPPKEVLGWSGMNPSAISDPVARAKYESAILENSNNNLMNRRQVALSEIESESRHIVISYLIDTFKILEPHPTCMKKICTSLLRVDENERKEIENLQR